MTQSAHNVGVVQMLGESHLHGGPIWGPLYILVLLWCYDLQQFNHHLLVHELRSPEDGMPSKGQQHVTRAMTDVVVMHVQGQSCLLEDYKLQRKTWNQQAEGALAICLPSTRAICAGETELGERHDGNAMLLLV